jgi:hypothetical protein
LIHPEVPADEVAQAAAEAERAEAEAQALAADEAAHAADAEAARAAAEERERELDVVPWLRKLGYSAEHARAAAERCAHMTDASLQDRVKVALRYWRQ